MCVCVYNPVYPGCAFFFSGSESTGAEEAHRAQPNEALYGVLRILMFGIMKTRNLVAESHSRHSTSKS